MEKKHYIKPGMNEVALSMTFCLMLSKGQGPQPTEGDSKLREFYSDDSESSSEFFSTNYGDY